MKAKLKQKRDDSYFDTLLSSHLRDFDLNPEEMARDNEKHFVDAYHGPQGPIKWMSEEEKDKVHVIIDEKMQEYEDSGLTRDEILHDKIGQGIPLREDPFFQYLKSNRVAREMMVKPG